MNDALLDYNEIIDEEIHAYEALENLYKVKESILIQGKSDALWDIDVRIVEHAKGIKELGQRRREIGQHLGNEEISLSEVIEKAEKVNKELAAKFSNQKKQLNILSKTLVLQQKTHMSLIEHGLTMVEKTMDIIFNVVAPQSQQYDKRGHNVQASEGLLSSITEEA